MTELTKLESRQVNGGILLYLAIAYQYFNGLQDAQKFGAGLGSGFYDGKYGQRSIP
ncbi:hypothetical protein [Alteromonas sp. C1M14]|uniref:hypothetical protein n=1 Tax=Alteromonas sp. C1M14 TaxID=2841567 RepID=UPI001C09A61A|nr:hypothetical protein [Alteromonas sp. C1M14]MBU2980167.1 hypothetical protein [Alteromonas sp. C1M14]